MFFAERRIIRSKLPGAATYLESANDADARRGEWKYRFIARRSKRYHREIVDVARFWTGQAVKPMQLSERMQAVQSPIIPVIGRTDSQQSRHDLAGTGGRALRSAAASRRSHRRLSCRSGESQVQGRGRNPGPGPGARAEVGPRERHQAGRGQPRRGHGRRQYGLLQRAVGDCRPGRRDHPA